MYGATKKFIKIIMGAVSQQGYYRFWIFNEDNFEIYEYSISRVSDYDIEIVLTNILLSEIILVKSLHHTKNDKILDILKIIPGKIYINKIETFRDLFKCLSAGKITNEKREIIKYLQNNFPQMLI